MSDDTEGAAWLVVSYVLATVAYADLEGDDEARHAGCPSVPELDGSSS